MDKRKQKGIRKQSAETRAKIAAAAKKRWSNPELKRAVSEKLTEKWADPEFRKQMEEADKKSWEGNETRRAVVSYKLRKHKRTKEHGENISKALKGKQSPFKGQSAETNEMIAEKTEKSRQYYEEHPEARTAISRRLKGKKKSEEHRKKLSEANKKPENYPPDRPGGHKCQCSEDCQEIVQTRKRRYARGHAPASRPQLGKYYQYIFSGADGAITFMRSSWEIIVAAWLDMRRIKWEYEQNRFKIGKGDWNGVHYIPDFYLPATDTYLEIKGWYSEPNRRKMKEFRKMYPEVKIRFLRKATIAKIKQLLMKKNLLPDFKACKIKPKKAHSAKA